MRRRSKKRGRKLLGYILIGVLGLELLGISYFGIFHSRPHVTPHTVIGSTEAVVVGAGLANAGDVATSNIVKKLLEQGVNVYVLNWSMTNMDIRAVYDALREELDKGNTRGEKLTSIKFLGGSLAGPVEYAMGEYFLEDGLPYGKMSLTMDGSFCTRQQVLWPQELIDGAPWLKSSLIVTALKAPLSYTNTSQALDNVEPGLSMWQLRWHHIRMAIFPMIGMAAQVAFIRDFVPDRRWAAAFSEIRYIVTPGDPLVNNEVSADCWRERAFPNLQLIKAPWQDGKHDPMAEQPSALAGIVLTRQVA